MDLSKLLNVIRGNKAADASAAPKDRPETEPVIPVEVSPTVAAADHPPPPVRTSGSVVQSLLGQFTGGHREPSPPTPPKTPPQGTANGYDDVLASVLPWSGGLIPGNDRHGKEDAAHGYRRPPRWRLVRRIAGRKGPCCPSGSGCARFGPATGCASTQRCPGKRSDGCASHCPAGCPGRRSLRGLRQG